MKNEREGVPVPANVRNVRHVRKVRGKKTGSRKCPTSPTSPTSSQEREGLLFYARPAMASHDAQHDLKPEKK